MDKVLVTGGAGFIGSHTCKLLYTQGYTPIVLDNLTTGNRKAAQWGEFVKADIRSTATLCEVLNDHRPKAVIHFAASAYVGESVTAPDRYFDNNVTGTLSLLNACVSAGIKNIIFSSSCATYGVPKQLPIVETTPQQPINPYGRTKLICEQILQDYAHAFGIRFAALRYFNACGADPEGELGEWHNPETHLIPRALMAAAGEIPHLDVFGNDYDTADGTCIRDYIHVSDLADGHLRALQFLLDGGDSEAFNLGTGKGTSIREILVAIKTTTGRSVPTVISPRRAGDPPSLYADPAKAHRILGFKAIHSDIETIIRTAAPFFNLEAAA